MSVNPWMKCSIWTSCVWAALVRRHFVLVLTQLDPHWRLTGPGLGFLRSPVWRRRSGAAGRRPSGARARLPSGSALRRGWVRGWQLTFLRRRVVGPPERSGYCRRSRGRNHADQSGVIRSWRVQRRRPVRGGWSGGRGIESRLRREDLCRMDHRQAGQTDMTGQDRTGRPLQPA